MGLFGDSHKKKAAVQQGAQGAQGPHKNTCITTLEELSNAINGYDCVVKFKNVPWHIKWNPDWVKNIVKPMSVLGDAHRYIKTIKSGEEYNHPFGPNDIRNIKESAAKLKFLLTERIYKDGAPQESQFLVTDQINNWYVEKTGWGDAWNCGEYPS